MKTILTAAGAAAIGIAVSSNVYAHSAMFPDYFKFDDSNEGKKIDPMKMQKAAAANCVNGSANGYPCNNVDFKSLLAKSSLGGGSNNLNDIWGWTDPQTGKEIAIVGRTHGTAFVDVTDAENPVHLGFLPSHDNGVDDWRDIKVYNDHAFIVADLYRNRTHGLQVFDLRTLRSITPNSTLSETAHFDGFGYAHNIAINESTGYAYIVGSNQCSGGLYMVNISNPAAPSYAGCFSSDGYTHDAQCVIYKGPDTRYFDKEICVGYNEDTLTIVDVTNKSNPVQISRTGYPGSQYTHQGWFLDDNHAMLIMNDERDEAVNGINTTSYIWDVSDLQNPRELGRYVGPTAATDHNLYTKNGYVVEANYRAGLRILSTTDIANGTLKEEAYFDTIPNSNSSSYSGAWSSYIYFESGNIVLSDIGTGLFVVTPDWAAIGNPQPDPDPNPAVFENTNSYSIPDNNSTGVSSPIDSTRSGASGTVSIAVSITHTYIGDLIVDLIHPDGTVYNLHNRSGGSSDNIQKTYTVAIGSKDSLGNWQLRVRDQARIDTGTINSWSITFQ